MQTRWEEKALHGRYPSRIKEADVDTKATNQWLKSSGLKAETEGLIDPPEHTITILLRMGQIHIAASATNPRKLLTILSRAAQS